MKFKKWLDTFVDEKGIDLEQSFELSAKDGMLHSLPYGVVIEAIKKASPNEQAAIKNKIIMLDFYNKDVKDFLRHLAGALVN
jgi:hypothetical protein